MKRLLAQLSVSAAIVALVLATLGGAPVYAQAKPQVLRGTPGGVSGVSFARDARHVATGGEDGAVWIWDTRARRPRPTILRGHDKVWIQLGPDFQMRTAAVLDVAFAPDSRRVASAGVDGTVRVWEPNAPRTPPVVLRGHGEGRLCLFAGLCVTGSFVRAVSYAPDGRHLASAGVDGTVRVWDVTVPNTPPVILRGHVGSVNAVAFAPDGRHLATGGEDKTIRVWDLGAAEAAPVILRGHTARVNSVAFASDGRAVASASDDRTVRVWNVKNPRSRPLILRGHRASAQAVAFAGDGRRVGSGGDDDTVRVWNLRKPRSRPLVLRGHRERVNAVEFSPDDRRLASASGDGTVRVWNVSTRAAKRPRLAHAPRASRRA